MNNAAPTGLPPVLYEDEWLIAFDKPSGLRVAPDPGAPGRLCLLQLLRERFSKSIFAAHRPDDELSGVVLFAKSKPALAAVTGQFQRHEETRRYLALVVHAPADDAMKIAQPVEPDPAVAGAMRIGGGKAAMAVTHVQTMERWRGYSLLAAIPATNKRHQIRVHLAQAGCPVLADALYGAGGGLKLSAIKPRYKFKGQAERPLIARLALHAESLTMLHPDTKAPLALRAPLPEDFALAIKYLNRYAGTGYRSEINGVL